MILEIVFLIFFPKNNPVLKGLRIWVFYGSFKCDMEEVLSAAYLQLLTSSIYSRKNGIGKTENKQI